MTTKKLKKVFIFAVPEESWPLTEFYLLLRKAMVLQIKSDAPIESIS